MRRFAWVGAMWLGAVAALAQSGDDERQIYRNVAPERLEAVLKSLDIKFVKAAGKAEGVHLYDFERNQFKIRLHNYGGKDLWIDAHFTDGLTAQEVNAWNVKAKFSRAVLLKSNEKPMVSLECQLDCTGGTNDAIVKQFVRRFDGELAQFVKFIAK